MKPSGHRGPNRLEDKSSSTAKFEVEDCQQQQGRNAIKTTLSHDSYRDLATQKLEASEVDTYMSRRHGEAYKNLEARGGRGRPILPERVALLQECGRAHRVLRAVSRTDRNFKKLDQRLQWPYRCILAKALFGFQGGERNKLSLLKGHQIVALSKGRCQKQDRQSGRLLPQGVHRGGIVVVLMNHIRSAAACVSARTQCLHTKHRKLKCEPHHIISTTLCAVLE
ncbi:unnamed protein product, partial [Trichogramma brassicae]